MKQMERALAFKKLSGGLAMPLDDTCPVLGWRIQTWREISMRIRKSFVAHPFEGLASGILP
jgi:hypothetical protein